LGFPLKELTAEEQTILQEMIDVSYQQFVNTVAQGRNLDVEKVKSFADGRIFTGQQALELGVVDRLGTEEDARRWAAELAGLNPEQAQCHTIEQPKPLWNRILSRNKSKSGLGVAIDWVKFELLTNGQPLWLYRP
jgi:protease IV